MTEKSRIMLALDSRWPMKYQDLELQDFAGRLAFFHLADIERALDEIKNTEKNKPAVSQILAKLKGKEPAVARAVPEMTHADAIRGGWGKGKDDMGDVEVYCRYWRGVYLRPAKDVQIRYAPIEDGHDPFGPAREESIANYSRRASSGLQHSLFTARFRLEEAELWSVIATYEWIEDFNRSLAALLDLVPTLMRPADSKRGRPIPMPEFRVSHTLDKSDAEKAKQIKALQMAEAGQ